MNEIPAPWFEAMLHALCVAPAREGEDAVVSIVLRAARALLPELGVGAWYTSTDCAGLPTFRIANLTPPGQEGRGAGATADRLFPGFAHERRYEMAGLPGSSVHLASDDAEVLREGALVERFGHVVTRTVARALIGAQGCAREKRANHALRETNEALVQAQKMASLGQFATGIVHELNNPLTSIVATVDWLRARCTEPESDVRLARIADAAQRMERLAQDVMTYARPSRESMVGVQIHEVIEHSLAHCEHVLAAANMTVVARRQVCQKMTFRFVKDQERVIAQPLSTRRARERVT